LVRRYDPLSGPDPTEWLGLDELSRIDLVTEYHRRKKERLPNRRLHATFHVVVENQLAEGFVAAQDALRRLMDGGLDRHEAVHAIGSVVASDVYSALSSGSARGEHEYVRRLSELTAERWLKNSG
jgi:hypothetical protein